MLALSCKQCHARKKFVFSLFNLVQKEHYHELEGTLQRLVQIVAAIMETSQNLAQSVSNEEELMEELKKLPASMKLVIKYTKESKDSTSAIDNLERSVKQTEKITENIENILGPFANSSKGSLNSDFR